MHAVARERSRSAGKKEEPLDHTAVDRGFDNAWPRSPAASRSSESATLQASLADVFSAGPMPMASPGPPDHDADGCRQAVHRQTTRALRHAAYAIRHNKCLYKINFIFITKILQHPIHIIDQMVPTVVGGELNPFVLHKTPQYLNEVSFWRICWKVENQQPFSFPFG